MRIRGSRECRECGVRWSYYETGSVTCPECGGVESRGLDDERELHTEGPATLDLSAVRAGIDERPLFELTEEAKATCRKYLRQDGFLNGGDLRPLDDTHLAARELVHVADLVERSTTPDDDAELYLLALLQGSDRGERPATGEVPHSLQAARGLAVSEAVRAYRRELRDWLEEHPRPEVEKPLGRIDQHARRVAALQGSVPPATAEALLEATRDLARGAREDDEAALAAVAERLDRLEPIQEE